MVSEFDCWSQSGRLYLEIIILLLSCTPDRVVQTVVITNKSESFVRIVGVLMYLGTIFAFWKPDTPELDIDMLAAWGSRLVAIQRYGQSVKVVTCFSRDTQDCRCNVGVGADKLQGVVFGNSGTTYDQRDADVSIVAAFFSRVQSVLRNMEPIICREEDVGVLEDVRFF